MSSCTHSTRSAEQRWPALSNAEVSTSATTCSGSARESTIIAFWPPVSAISGIAGRACRAGARRERRVDQLRHFGRAGEHHALHARVGDTAARRRLAVAGQQLQRAARDAGLVQQAHRLVRRSAAFARPAWRAPALPAASAAATWPVKIASGKFHGLMQATAPSGRAARTPERRATCAA